MLLTQSFSPEGSNRKKNETELYSLFVKYLREVASKFHNNIYMYTGCSQSTFTFIGNLQNITKNDLSTMAVSSYNKLQK